MQKDDDTAGLTVIDSGQDGSDPLDPDPMAGSDC
jgi:hypothetical protein